MNDTPEKVKACVAERDRKEQVGENLFWCRLPDIEGCPRSFRSYYGRNQHERRGHRS